MRRRGWAMIAAVSCSLVLTAASTTGVAATGGPGPANGNQCNPVVVTGQFGTASPVPVQENATVYCPFESGTPGVPTGPSGPLPGPYTPGQTCSYVTYQPIKIVVSGAQSVTEMDPSANGAPYTPIGYPPDLAPVPIVTQEQSDIYMPYLFSGKADASGNCTKNITSKLGCPNPQQFTNFVVAGNVCWTTFPHPGVGQPIPPGPGIPPFLDAAHLLQFIGLGTMSSLPDNPGASLVNIGTCFFLNGATFQGLGGAPRSVTTPAFYEMRLAQPLGDGTGRSIFYVFRIELALTGLGWDFGDGSTTPDPSLPPACGLVPAQFSASHTYLKYGTFPVTITENYAVTVTEYWHDARGINVVPLTGLIPPITRVLGPYMKTVLQEEGVPVGGG